MLRIVHSSLFAALCALLAAPAAAADRYPDRPIRLIAGFPPGGGVDINARLLADPLGQVLGQTVVVDNRPGAGGRLGMELVSKASPDGYTLGLGGIGMAISRALYKSLPYDTLRDFIPVAYIAAAPFLLVLHPSVPAASVTELIGYIKTKPGGINYGSSGVGGAAHLAGEMFKTAAGVNLTHIPYKGAAPAMTDLIGGQVPMVFDPIPTSLPHVRGGRIKALAITSARRTPLMPEVPTVAESGLPGYEVAAWFGLYAPAATPADIVGKLNTDVNRVLQMPEVKEKFAALGADSAPMTTDQFALHLRAEIAKFAKAIKDSGATAE